MTAGPNAGLCISTFYVGAWYQPDQHVSQAILKVRHLRFYMVRGNVK